MNVTTPIEVYNAPNEVKVNSGREETGCLLDQNGWRMQSKVNQVGLGVDPHW